MESRHERASEIDLVALDLDGTLVDSAPDINHCVGLALIAAGHPAPTLDQTRSMIGGGIDLLIRRALDASGGHDEHSLGIALARFHACYRDNLFERSRLYAGVTDTIATLHRAGIRLCCITNKRSDYAIRLLELAALRDRFAFVFGGDSFPEKKPHPRPLIEAARSVGARADRCTLVGDASQDCRAAAAAGFRFVWAAYGYCRSLDEVADSASYERIESFDELATVLRAA